jgi:hypothetical protein
MTKLLNSLVGWSIVGLIAFAYIGQRNQDSIIRKIGQYFESDTQDVQEFIKNMREDKARRAEYLEKNKDKFSPETIAYFDEIAMGIEDGRKFDHVTRYTEDVVIYMEGHQPQYIVDELNDIVSELNGIINSVEISVTEYKSDANMIVSIGSLEKVRREYPCFNAELFDHCNGGFTSLGNESNVFLNTNNIRTVEHAKHVLREEVTQAMGLPNDSYKYPESIFYEGSSEVTEYAQIDRELIDILYNN